MKKIAAWLLMAAAWQLAAYEYFVESGDYRIKITGKNKHTIRQIIWKKFEVGTPSGHYGAIVVPKPGKFIGAGHTEGGEEKVLQVKVVCDGKVVTPGKGVEIKGRKILIDKLSQFANLLFNVRLEITPDGVVESKRFVALAEQNVYAFYAHIFCFNKSFTDFSALSDDGKIVKGKFALPKLDKVPKDVKSVKKIWHVRKSVKYIAEYDAAAGKGVLLYYPEIIKGKFFKSTIWEVPYGYMKYYMMTDLPEVIPSGWESPVYTVILRCFEAENAEAMQQILPEQAEELAKVTLPTLNKPVLPPDCKGGQGNK